MTRLGAKIQGVKFRAILSGLILFSFAVISPVRAVTDSLIVSPAGGSNGDLPVELLTIGEPLTGSGSNEIEGLGFAYTVPPTLQISSPTRLSIGFADATSSDRLLLNWVDNSDDELGFIIERSTDGINFERMFVPSTTTYIDNGLATATHYYYHVKAYKAFAESEPSNSGDKYTRAAIPVKPGFSSVSRSKVSVVWEANGNPDTVVYAAELSTIQTFDVLTASASLRISSIPFVFGGLELQTTYYFRVKAVNYENVPTSYTVPISTLTTETIPYAPSALDVAYADVSGSGKLSLSWTDNSDNEAGFVVERATGASAYTWIGFLPLPPNTTTFTDTDIADATTYAYRVKAYNKVGESAFSNVASTKTLVTFVDIGGIFPSGGPSSVEWGDFDNDGDLDFVTTGWGDNGKTPGIYRNDNGSFVLHFSLPIGMKSASWIDYDNDGDLDLAVASGGVKLYRNDNGIFTAADSVLPYLNDPSFAWGDYDNDGFKDLALTGRLMPDDIPTSRIYHNNNGTIDTSIYTTLPGFKYGAVAWGDYDNDGALDLAITGYGGAGAGIYHNELFSANNFNGSSFSYHAGLPNTSYGSVTWGDCDNDGYSDLLLTGLVTPGNYGVGRLYRNNNGGFDTSTFTVLPGVSNGASAWGDYDNDGDLDLALVGETSSTSTISAVFRNDNGVLKDIHAALPGGRYSIAWGDFGKDAHLDLAFISSSGAKIFLNKNGAFNSLPEKPSLDPIDSQYYVAASNNQGEYLHSKLLLNVIPGADAETPSNMLHYEVVLATADMAANPAWHGSYVASVVLGAGVGSSPSQTDSKRPLFIFSDLPRNATYYWKVRAVDTGLLKSEWSDQKSIYIPIHSLSYNDGVNVMTLSAEQEDVWANVVWSTDTIGAVVLATATAQGLTTLGYIYDLGPENTAFAPPLEITFHYSLALLPPGMTEDDIGVYHYNAISKKMEYVDGQAKDKTNKIITAQINYISSIFALMGHTPDTISPFTALVVSGGGQVVDAHGKVFYSSSAVIELAADDPVINTVGSGVDYSQFRIDGGELLLYHSPFTLSDGCHVVEYRSADKAGNLEIIKSTAVCVDATAPVSSAVLAGIYGNSWYSSPVTVTVISSDSLSGVVSIRYSLDSGPTFEYTKSFEVIADGEHYLKYYAIDGLGNRESEKILAFSIDRTAPQVSYSLVPEPNSIGWNNSPAMVSFAGVDPASGVIECSSVTTATEGYSQKVAGWCRDGAGNVGYSTATINIDLTAPAVMTVRKPAPNAAGWNNADVTVEFACSDGLSGIKVCPSTAVFAAEGVSLSTAVTAYDMAGNSTRTVVSGIRIDKTAPVISISSPAAGNSFVATKDVIKPFFSVTDNFDPAPVYGAWLEQVEDRGSPRGSRPAKIAVVNGQSIEPLDIDDGLWKLAVSATDFADNAVAVSGGTFEVIHDVLAPDSDLRIDGTHYETGGTIYLKHGSAFTLSSLDDLVQAGDGIGLGVKKQLVTVSASGSELFSAGFDNPLPKQGEPFVSTHTFSSLGTVPDGRYSLDFKAEDVLGNIEAVKHSYLGLDDTPPEPAAQLAGISGDNGWYISSVTISLSAADALSGVDGIFYRVDGSTADAFAAYTGAITVSAEGRHTILFYAKDNLGNTSAIISEPFKIDLTVPAVSKAVSPAANQAGWHNGLVKVNFSGSDAVSGISYCEPAKTLLAEGRNLEVSGYCRDFAGLSSTVTASFNMDLTSPTISAARSPLANAYGWNNGDVTVAFACSDALSGIKTCPQERLFSAEGAGQGISGTAADYADNMSGASMGGINIDKTAAESSLSVGGDVWQDAGKKYLSLRSLLSLAAADPVSGGTASGVEAIEHSIDHGQFTVYASSFGLSEGSRSVAFRALDKAGNVEPAKSAEFQVDGTSPLTALTITGGMQFAGPQPGSFYASPASRFGLAAADPAVGGVASGVKLTSWSDNGGVIANSTAAIAFGEGLHVLTYRSLDNVNNLEVLRSTTILVDNTAPVSAYHIGSPYYADGGVNYITPATPVAFTAADPVSGEAASGVNRIEISVDGGVFSAYSAALRFTEGRHTISFRAIDNVGNIEAAQNLLVRSDNTAPASRWLVGSGENIELSGKFYLNALGKIALESADPVAAEVVSGVEGTFYGIDAAPADRYGAPFGLVEGIRTLNFLAKDNVGNAEVIRSTVIYVDGTKPVSELSVSGDQYHGDRLYVSLRSDIVLTASDPVVSEVASGVKATQYSVDGGAFTAYAAFKLSAEGKRIVGFYSADNVNNVEDTKASELWVDDTVPVTELSIAGARHDKDGLIYITRDSGIVLTAADPVANETASGVLLTKYRLDGGDWQVYAGSFTITAEGRHTLEYYSLDRVQNTEQLRTASLAVDNTPPATAVTLGEPKFEVFGLPVLTPAAPITLAAADVLSAEVASGLKQVFYQPVNAETGQAAVYSYTQPFTLPQGTYDLRYWSVDNLGNEEPYKQVRFAVSTFQDDSLQAVESLDMSGTADISGAVRSNGLVGMSGNARILGDVAASTITLVGKAQITGQLSEGAVPISPEPIFLGALPGIAFSSVPAGYVLDGKLAADSQAVVVLSTGIYHFRGIALAGGASLRIDGKVDLLVSGDISIGGGAALNSDGAASSLNIFVDSASSITFTGGGSLVANIYAPLAHMKLAGNALLGGHFFVRNAAVSGTGNILQAGETLPRTTAATGDPGGKKRASAFGGGGTYEVLAGPDPAFRLGEVYVFPNPALRGAAPTLHIEAGIADRVKITFYTVSGRHAHEAVLTGQPVPLDDGNGLAYAYEYTWRDSIPSGVYYYYVEAEKGGAKLKKAGKFAVVR